MDLLNMITIKQIQCVRLHLEPSKGFILMSFITRALCCLSGLTWDEDGHLLILTSEKRVVKWNSRNQKLSRLAITCWH